MNRLKKNSLLGLMAAATLGVLAGCQSNPTVGTSYNADSKLASSSTIDKNNAYKSKLDAIVGSDDDALAVYNKMACSYEYDVPRDPATDLTTDDCLNGADEVLEVGEEPGDYWNREGYSFLDGMDNPFEAGSTYSEHRINPSLLRMAKLNNAAGLDDVGANSGGLIAPETVYQIRGMDLSVMSIIKDPNKISGDTRTGWIIVDPLTSKETAAKGWEIFLTHIGDADKSDNRISAVILTHSHLDHFGGIFGLAEAACEGNEEAFFKGSCGENGPIDLLAPEGFFEHSVSENVMAGNIMGRRAGYMYGNLIEPGRHGAVDGGLGKVTSSGNPNILEAVEINTNDTYTLTSGTVLDIQMANGSEAPAEFMFYMDDYNLMMAAEVLTNTIHNISSMRGAKTRDALAWVGYVNEVLDRFDDKAQVMIASHHWPTFGNAKVVEQMEKSRDMYKFVHDQALRLANNGLTPTEIADTIELPESLDKEWYNHGYYGTVSHNSRATYDFYLGAWWDGNPANLNPMTPAQEGIRYIDAVGGIDNLMATAGAAYAKGEYRWVVRLMNHAVFGYNQAALDACSSCSSNMTINDATLKQARYLAADAMEQLGYQSESGPWRNYYLGAAKELRNEPGDYPDPGIVNPAGIAMNMPLYMGLDALSLMVNPDHNFDNGDQLFEKSLYVEFRVSEDGSDYGYYYLKLSNSALKIFQNPGNSEKTGEDTNIDTGYTMPGDGNYDVTTKVSLTKKEFQIWLAEVMVNGNCNATSDYLHYEDGSADTLKEFCGAFEPFTAEFGIATP